MSTANTQVTSEGLAKLRKIIEDKLDRKMCTPADFIFLSDVIARNVNPTLTLKKISEILRAFFARRFCKGLKINFGFVAATSRFADFRNVGHIREKKWL